MNFPIRIPRRELCGGVTTGALWRLCTAAATAAVYSQGKWSLGFDPETTNVRMCRGTALVGHSEPHIQFTCLGLRVITDLYSKVASTARRFRVDVAC